MVKRCPLKCKYLRLSSGRVKIRQIPYVNFETTSWFLSKFASLFIFMTHNSSINFKLIHFLFWIKSSHQNPNFETFECSGENFPDSAFHFLNRKLVFLEILHHSSVSQKITPLYSFSSNIIYFGQKEPIEVQIYETLEC